MSTTALLSQDLYWLAERKPFDRLGSQEGLGGKPWWRGAKEKVMIQGWISARMLHITSRPPHENNCQTDKAGGTRINLHQDEHKHRDERLLRVTACGISFLGSPRCAPRHLFPSFLCAPLRIGKVSWYTRFTRVTDWKPSAPSCLVTMALLRFCILHL
jgi:hypothetical protein